MDLDIRMPLGWLFVLLGGTLAIYGVLDPGAAKQSLNVNMNLYWGLAMVAFGLVMAIPATLKSKK